MNTHPPHEASDRGGGIQADTAAPPSISRHYWRTSELALLRARYFAIGARGVAALLGRSPHAVYQQAYKAGIRADRTATRRRAGAAR